MSCNNAFLNSKYASSFSPANLRGLAVWLNANDSNSITQSAGVVSAWLDRSPNAYTMSQATAGNRPTIESNVRNGNSALRFTTTQALTSTAAVALTSDATWFLVVNPLAAGNLFFIEQSTDTNSFPGTYMYGGNNFFFYTTRLGSGRAFVDASATPFPLSNWYVITAMFSNRSTAATDLYWAYNGLRRSGTTGSVISVSSISSNLFINPLTRVPGSNYMGELIIYNRPLSYGEIYTVERYLADKWAVPLRPPHPYTTIPSALRPFNPLDICGLTVWFDAADRRRMDLSLSGTNLLVRSWSNKAALAQDFSLNTTGATFMTYITDSRGYPAMNWPGAQRYVSSRADLSRAVFFSDSCTCTVFTAWDICGTTTATNAGAFIAAGVAAPTTTRAGVFFTGSTGAGFFQVGTSTGATVNMPAQALGTPRVQTFRRNALEMIYRNFGTQTTSNNAATAPQTQSNTLYRFDIPYQANVGGRVYEMLWYNRALVDTEINAVEVYLAEKWGLRSSLTTGVPPRFTRALTPVFTPVQISNCVLWLDAADPSTVTLSSGSVTAVLDKSSSVTLSNCSGFTYPNNTFNGTRPSFFVSGGGNSGSGAQRLGVNSAFALATPFTVSFVSQHVGAANYGFIIDSGPSGTGRPYILDGFAGPRFETPFGGGGLITTSPLFNTFIFGSTAVAFQNGTQQFTGSASFTTGGITVGNRFTLNESWPGHICEIILHNTALTTAQRQQVEGYLAWKWGLVGNLPNDHPYKTIPV